MNFEEIIGILAGVFTTLGVLPQIIKAIRTKKVNDVSPLMFIVLCLGVGFWIVYGILKMDWPIILTNSISFILNAIMLYIIFSQKEKV
ncbi:SemiSWEET family sugar transporter [Gelidibacter mesophilus]|uniref:SemiSWEET family sugar transporter n=1 Tax=Gelidibacter mesophilus TaxID=169050 RepID=UPI00042726B3|nr:SemiSWEET transporter [Gelidibacter mesophilus]